MKAIIMFNLSLLKFISMCFIYLRFRKPPVEQYAAIGQLYGLNPDPQRLKHAYRYAFVPNILQ